MADRRDFDDIKLIAGADEPLKIGGIKPDDLRDLESDLLSSVDLNDDLLDDLGELSASATRPKKRKSSSTGLLGTLLVLILFGGGAGYAYLNKDTLMPLLMGGDKQIFPKPGDLPEVTKGPALTPDAPVATNTSPIPEAPVVPGSPAPAVTTVEPPVPDAGFTDGLPQPDQITNAGVSGDVKEIVLPSSAAVSSPAPLPSTVKPDVAVPVIQGAPVVLDKNAKKPDDASLQSAPSVGLEPVVIGPGPTDLSVAPKVAPSVPVTPVPPTTAMVEATGPSKNDPAEPSDLGNLKMPNLPDLQKSMDGKDDFLESKSALEDMSDMSASRLNLSSEQKSRGLGISVKDSKSPSAKTTADKASATPKVDPKQDLAFTGTASAQPGVPTISDTESNIVMGDNVEEKIAAANRALDLERFQAAYDMFSDLYKDNARDERILMGRAVALQKLGRVDEAIGAYDELLAVAPNNPDVMVNALGLVRQKNPTDALVRLMELRQKFPMNATVAAQIGLVNAELQKYDEGIQYLNIAADLESTNPKHFFNMAVISERMGRMDKAIEYYEHALKADALSTNSKNKIDRDMIYDRLSYLRQSAP